jgi:outer membrane protein, heavy metal efflux system
VGALARALFQEKCMKAVWIVMVAAWLAPWPADAQVPARATLASLIEEAVANSPEVAAARQRVDAAEQRPFQERSLPDPMVSASWASVGKPFPGAGLGDEPMANVGVMVTQPIPYPGKRGLRAAIAERETDAERQQLEAARLGVIARVKQAYYRVAYTAAAQAVLARNQQLLDTLLKVSEARYGVGRAAQQDVFKGQAELTVLEIQQERLRQERRTREAELNALLNRAPGASIGEPEPLTFVPFEMPLDALLEQARANAPVLRREESMIAAAETAVDAARREYKPDFAVSGGYFNQGSMPAMYEFRFEVTVPLRRARRAAAVQEQASRLGAARLTRDASERSLEARVQEDYQMASSAARLAGLYRDTLLPQVRLALESSLASYQTGAIEFLSVLTNFTAVLDNEMRYLDELADFHVAASRLEEMTGTPLVH